MSQLQKGEGAGPTVVLDRAQQWADPELPSLFIDTIFRDKAFCAALKQELAEAQTKVTSLEHLLTLARETLQRIGREAKVPDVTVAENLLELARYVEALPQSLDAYDNRKKPNPKAVWYPNPTRARGRSVYDTLPVVTNYGIVNKTTPMGSAGSCFAFEIAAYLQRNGFNYVVTEKGQDLDRGIIQGVPGPEETKECARFCANWGLLFNSPSMAQLAEKAFGKRELPRLLVHAVNDQGSLLYTDPYRENVWFTSPEAFEADYERHREAVRKALLQAEVFIVTLGSNECWQFIGDGSVISRYPRHYEIAALLRLRTFSVEENVSCLQRFVDVVRAHNPDFKLIVSVSPVPLWATGRGHNRHVITANAHSKAVLRVAAEELVARNRDVYYLPSYELVMTGIKDPWEADERHVKRSAVQRVMTLFESTFVNGRT